MMTNSEILSALRGKVDEWQLNNLKSEVSSLKQEVNDLKSKISYSQGSQQESERKLNALLDILIQLEDLQPDVIYQIRSLKYQ